MKNFDEEAEKEPAVATVELGTEAESLILAPAAELELDEEAEEPRPNNREPNIISVFASSRPMIPPLFASPSVLATNCRDRERRS